MCTLFGTSCKAVGCRLHTRCKAGCRVSTAPGVSMLFLGLNSFESKHASRFVHCWRALAQNLFNQLHSAVQGCSPSSSSARVCRQLWMRRVKKPLTLPRHVAREEATLRRCAYRGRQLTRRRRFRWWSSWPLQLNRRCGGGA